LKSYGAEIKDDEDVILSKKNALSESSGYSSRVPQNDVGRQGNILFDLRRCIGETEEKFPP
jgi:hypothetical protein